MPLLTILLCSIVFSKFSNKSTFLDDATLKEDVSSKSGMFAIMVENDDGDYVEYTDSDIFPTDMLFNEENSGCVDASGNTVNATLSYSDGYVSISTNESVYCYLYFDLPLNCVRDGITNLAECLLISENNFDSEEEAIEYIKNGKGTPDFSVTATTDEGLYYATDDYGDSYYFRGAVTDNYVYFAGYYWRIIRINGDGSIRMIYDGTKAYDNGDGTNYANRYISMSDFNDIYIENKYVGYMYGDSSYSVTETSTVKTLQEYYYYYAFDYTFDTETGYYTLSDDASQEVWNSDLVGSYTCRSASATGTCTSLWKIAGYTNNYQGTYYKYTSTSETDENDVTTYTESHGTSTSTGTMATRYYYGTDYSFDTETGLYTLVDYAYDVYNGDGSLTDYYTCGSTSYRNCSTLYYITEVSSETDATVTKNAVTYSTTYADGTENKYSSTIKTVVDNWYYTNIYNKTDGTNSYDDYISDTSFCNDRSLYGGTGIGTTQTYYGAYRRIEKKSPILTCPNKTNDAFTVDDEVNGNGDLTYKIGLITADEVAMAGGGSFNFNITYYLYIGSWFWTMSPHTFDVSRVYEWLVYPWGSLISYSSTATKLGVRPVINLSSSVILTSGDGTMDSPYTVALS